MSWLWWVQIAADVVLLAVLVMLMSRLRSGDAGGGGLGDTPDQARRFVAEAQRLTGEFDRILNEKRELIGTTLKGLDARIARLREMTRELEERAAQATPAAAPQAAPEPPEPEPAPPSDGGLAAFRQKVLELSRQGKGAAQIAESTGRSRGEVELVLGLSARSG